MDGELAGPGAEDIAGDADMVSQVQQLVELKALFSHGIQANVDLQPFTALLQLGKACLALGADGHDAPGDRDHGPLRVERFGGNLSELLAHLREGMGSDEVVGVCLLAKRGNLAQLVFAQREKIALEFRLKQWDASKRKVSITFASLLPNTADSKGTGFSGCLRTAGSDLSPQG